MKLIMLKYKRHLSGEQKEYIRVNWDEAKGKQKDEATLEYFFVFFKIGPSTFGGGYAMIATIEEEIVRKRVG